MGQRKNLAAQRRARSAYRKRLFAEKLDEWENENKRDIRLMPTLKVYFDGLEHILRDHRLTDEMHVFRTGEPWPRKPREMPQHLVQRTEYPVPHANDAVKRERIARVREQLEDAPEAKALILSDAEIEYRDRVHVYMQLNPGVDKTEVEAHVLSLMQDDRLARSDKPKPMIDFEAFEQGK